MINWHKTDANKDTVKNSDKVAAICSICNKNKTINYRSYKRCYDKLNHYRCKSCYLKSNEARLKVSESTSKLWESDHYRKKQSDIRKKTQPERSKKIWKDHRDKIVSGLRSSKLGKQKRSKITKGLWQSPDFRNKVSQSMLKWWDKESNRTKMATRTQPRISKIHKITSSILNELNIEHHNEVVIGPWSFDILIKRDNKTDILLEINGDYIHSLPNKKRSDKAKYTYYEKYLSNEYDLKYLWEHEFYNQNRIIALLQSWTSTAKLSSFSFNNISITTIDLEQCEQFLEKYHYLSRLTRRGIYKGAFLGNVLTAVCVFSPPIRKEVATNCGYNHNDILELSRFCIHPMYQKKNFASWLLSRFTNNLTCKAIVAFSDETHNHFGTIYKASNWKYVHAVKPDYWYVSKDGLATHKKTLWNRATNLKMTEIQFAEQKGYTKIFGKQKHKYILEL